MTVSAIVILYSIERDRLEPPPTEAKYNRVLGLQYFVVPPVLLETCLWVEMIVVLITLTYQNKSDYATTYM